MLRLWQTICWRKSINTKERNEYFIDKQTIIHLSIKYGRSKKSIQRKIDSVINKKENAFSSVVIVLMDTTYCGRSFFGIMVFKANL